MASAPGSVAPGAACINGTWNGTWKDTTDSGNGTFVVNWLQAGSQLTGTITVKGAPCLTTGLVTGTVNGSAITFGAVSGAVTINYTGSVSGNTMSGTYTAPTCGDAQGNWSATKS